MYAKVAPMVKKVPLRNAASRATSCMMAAETIVVIMIDIAVLNCRRMLSAYVTPPYGDRSAGYIQKKYLTKYSF